ncbi:MAG: oligosaccharide flippase family protein [Gemmataceae bacterium]
MIHVSDRLQVFISNLAAQVMRILGSLILVRCLGPAAFGKVDLVAAVAGLVAGVGDFGLRRFLVQNRDWPEEELRDTLVVLLFGSGVVLLLLNVGAGFYVAQIENNVMYFWIGAGLGLTALLSAVHDTQLACMSRRLAFRAEVKQQTIVAVAQFCSGVGFALAGFGAFSLILQAVVAQVVANISIQWFEPLRWPRHFNRAIARSCLRPGLHMGLAYYLTSVVLPLQRLFVVRIGGEEILGIFGRLVALKELVNFNVIQAFERLIFPLFSQNQHDVIRLRELFLRGSSALTVIVVFCGWGLVTTSPELVLFLGGPAWQHDPRVLPALCLPLLLNAGAGWVAMYLGLALGRSNLWSLYGVVVIVGNLIAGVIALQMDLASMALLFGVAQLAAWAVVIGWVLRKLQMTPWPLVRRLTPAVLIGLASGGFTLLVKTQLLQFGTNWQRLILTGTLFSAMFILLAWLCDPETVAEVRRMIRRKPLESPPTTET